VWRERVQSFIETKHTSLPKYTPACECRGSKELSYVNLIKLPVSDEYYLRQLSQYQT
jgi:hypothetical protein